MSTDKMPTRQNVDRQNVKFFDFYFSSYGNFSVIFGFLNFEIQSFRHSLLFHQFFCSTFCLSTFCLFNILSVDILSVRHFVSSTVCLSTFYLSTFCPTTIWDRVLMLKLICHLLSLEVRHVLRIIN